MYVQHLDKRDARLRNDCLNQCLWQSKPNIIKQKKSTKDFILALTIVNSI